MSVEIVYNTAQMRTIFTGIALKKGFKDLNSMSGLNKIQNFVYYVTLSQQLNTYWSQVKTARRAKKRTHGPSLIYGSALIGISQKKPKIQIPTHNTPVVNIANSKNFFKYCAGP